MTQQFLSREVAKVIDFPSNSPNANSVENLLSIIKRCVEKRKTTNLEELNKFLHEEWVNIDVVVLNHLINSMKSGCLELNRKERELIIKCDTFVRCAQCKSRAENESS